jgi:hypothetical protein
MPQINIRIVRLPFWAIVLIGSFVIALIVAVAILALGLVLVLVPIVLGAAAIMALSGWSRRRRPDERGRPPMIETDYVVLDDGRKKTRKSGKGRVRRNTTPRDS